MKTHKKLMSRLLGFEISVPESERLTRVLNALCADPVAGRLAVGRLVKSGKITAEHVAALMAQPLPPSTETPRPMSLETFEWHLQNVCAPIGSPASRAMVFGVDARRCQSSIRPGDVPILGASLRR